MSTMSVNELSPREVKDFYGAVFKPIDDIIAANAAHNRMVKLIAREEGAPLIDMAAGVDGVWDDDLYLDIVHFTEAGNERVAGLMFRALYADPGRAAWRARARFIDGGNALQIENLESTHGSVGFDVGEFQAPRHNARVHDASPSNRKTCGGLTRRSAGCRSRI